MNFQAAARAIRGSKDVQEDAFRVCDAKGGDADDIASSDEGVALSGGGLLLVADGIGGHYGGDVASAITADTFTRTFFAGGGAAEEKLKTALNAANQAVADAQIKEPGLKDMGATLVAGFFDGERMSFVSVGDSLILRFREGELHRVNEDHSYMEIADREALGSGDPALWRDVMMRKGRDSITIAVLGRSLEDFGHTPQIATRTVLPGDVLIFASDGLETLSMVQIQNFVRTLLPRGVAAVADGLIKAIDGIGQNRNYQDNATLIVALADGAPAQRTAVTSEKDYAKIDDGQTVAAAKPQLATVTAVQAEKSSTIMPKLLLGLIVCLIGLAVLLFASGRLDVFRGGLAKIVPTAAEQGLQQRPAIVPENDPQPPVQRGPKGSQSPGG